MSLSYEERADRIRTLADALLAGYQETASGVVDTNLSALSRQNPMFAKVPLDGGVAGIVASMKNYCLHLAVADLETLQRDEALVEAKLDGLCAVLNDLPWGTQNFPCLSRCGLALMACFKRQWNRFFCRFSQIPVGTTAPPPCPAANVG